MHREDQFIPHLIVSNGLAGMVMGIAYRGAGLGFLPAVLFSLVVYSATAQAVTLGLWAMPPPLAAMVVAEEHAIFRAQTQEGKPQRRDSSHRRYLSARKVDGLGKRRRGSGCFKRRIGVSGEELFRAVRAQVFSGRVEIPEL